MTQPQKTVLHNPFVGLRPYRSEESIYFFGRGEQTKRLLGLLHEHHFVAVVGSSGSGKSSLVRAGLIPKLEAGFLAQERDRWHIAIMQPGEAPLRKLILTLLAITGKRLPKQDETRLLVQVQERGVQALLDILTSIQENPDTNLLLLVDQFEELFRFALEQEERRHLEQAESFVALLLRLCEQRQLPIFVCLTMRSDFLGDCDAFYGLPEAISRSQFLVPRLTRDQRREAITSPIILAGGRIAPRLSDRLLNENIDFRDDLPILQHLLMRCWVAWQADQEQPAQIDLHHYEQVHTIHHALNNHADEALQELDEGQQAIAKTLFQILTTTDAANRHIRRSAHLKEVSFQTGATLSQVDEVIEAFIRRGRSFMVLSDGETADNPLIDISHESLIRQWQQLGTWVNEEAAAAKIYRRLVESAELHTADNPRYYREADLAQALEWRQEHNAIWAIRYPGDFALADSFLQQSKTLDEQERNQREQVRQERERLLREKAEMAEQQAEQEQITVRKTRRLLTITSIIAILMFISTGAAWLAWDQTTKQTLIAELYTARAFEEKALHALEKAKKGNKISDYQDAWLYALEASLQKVPKGKAALQPETIGSFVGTGVQQVFTEKWFSPALNTESPVTAAAFSPDGKTLISGARDKNLRLWDAATGQPLRTLQGHTDWVTAVAFSPDGKTLLSGARDNTLHLWDAATGQPLHTLHGHTNSVRAVAFSRDGKTLLSSAWDKTLRLWDTATGQSLRTLHGHTGPVTAVAFSPNGKTLLSGAWDKTLRLWDAATGQPLRTLQGHTGPVSAVAFSSDGKTLLSGAGDKTLRLWDAATGQPLRALQGHTNSVNAVVFSPNGKILLSGAGDNTVRLWDVADFQTLRTLATYPALATKVSEALQLLWERSLEDNITFVRQPRRPALFPIKGYHLADATKYRELLNPPAQSETKLDQVLRWARKALEQRTEEKM